MSASPKGRTTTLVSWIAAVTVATAALLYGAIDEGTPETNADRAYELAKDFACPVCQGQSVAESDVPVARNIRRQIRVWVDEGRTDTEIRDELVASFDEDIDYSPPTTGVSVLVWVLPVLVLIGGAAAVTVVVRRGQQAPRFEATDDDEVLVAGARRQRPDAAEPGGDGGAPAP